MVPCLRCGLFQCIDTLEEHLKAHAILSAENGEGWDISRYPFRDITQADIEAFKRTTWIDEDLAARRASGRRFVVVTMT